MAMSMVEAVTWLPRFILSRLLAVPIYLKILGIGGLVAAVFASVMTFHARPQVARTLYSVHQARARAATVSLASVLGRPLSSGDLFMVQQHLDNTMLAFPDVRYAVVYDESGRLIAHTFQGEPPLSVRRPPRYVPPEGSLQNLPQGTGHIFDVTMPILEGREGVLRVGVSDEMVTRELSALTRSVLWGLVICLIVGQGLAALLAVVLTRPIHELERASNRLGQGQFDHRARVMWSDEIGRLAIAFNQMADSVQGYREQVMRKEEARLVLLKKIVQAQEDERRSISLELHDELGQSLMALLLSVHGLKRSGDLTTERAAELEAMIRYVSDEVRRIARQMRPSILDDGGLDCALASYVEDLAARSPVAIDYQCLCSGDPDRLPSEVEVTLYRIAQESLTNVLRHSQAHQASVVLYRTECDATLVVEDDGVGFDLADPRGNSLGLVGMNERATLLGGELSIQSSLGIGTTIRARMPLMEYRS
jgi:signal transduction histidine kinase